jgi:hypothetical protein
MGGLPDHSYTLLADGFLRKVFQDDPIEMECGQCLASIYIDITNHLFDTIFTSWGRSFWFCIVYIVVLRLQTAGSS